MSEKMIKTWNGSNFYAAQSRKAEEDVNGNSLELSFNESGEVSTIGGNPLDVSEAPIDNHSYVRKNGNWTELSTDGPYIYKETGTSTDNPTWDELNEALLANRQIMYYTQHSADGVREFHTIGTWWNDGENIWLYSTPIYDKLNNTDDFYLGIHRVYKNASGETRWYSTSWRFPVDAPVDDNTYARYRNSWVAIDTSPIDWNETTVYDADPYGAVVIEHRDESDVAVINEDCPFIEPVTTNADSIEFNSTYNLNVLNTVWFPFTTTADNITNCTIYELKHVTMVNWVPVVTSDDMVELSGSDIVKAGTPYLMIPTGKIGFNLPDGVDIDTVTVNPYNVDAGDFDQIPFIPCTNYIERFGDLPDWNSTICYGIFDSDDPSKAGKFSECTKTSSMRLFKSYLKMNASRPD